MDAITLINVAEALFKLGVDIAPAVGRLYDSFKDGNEPTDEEWEQMRSDEAVLVGAIRQPFPEDGV